MMFDVSNSNTGGKCLCDTCRYKQEKKVKSKQVEIFTYCPKWQATVEGVGVCKYYEPKPKEVTNLYYCNLANCVCGQVVPDMLQGWKYEERPQCKWIYHENHIECNKCQVWFLKDHLIRKSFCPNCGAEMKGGAE